MLMFCIRHGESTYNAVGRVQGHLNIPLELIARCDYSKVIVVSHGAILAAAFRQLLEIPAQRHPFMLENASISLLEIDGSISAPAHAQ